MARIQPSFEAFFGDVEPRLRHALVARYGPSTGRAVTVDALSYAWEHWDRLSSMDNPVGYLYRVGQSASRRYGGADATGADQMIDGIHIDEYTATELAPALAALSDKQRVTVVLVHGLGWTHSETADLLAVSTSTVQTHIERALAALRRTLEVSDV